MRRMMRQAGVVAALVACTGALAGCGGGLGIRLTSPAFKDGGVIPARYTCDGAGESPPLQWTGVPPYSKGLALLVGDADAPQTAPFIHWTVWNLPPSVRQLAAGRVPAGAEQGRNSYGTIGYGPPCPPPGARHHYTFMLYALGGKMHLAHHAPPSALFYEIGAEQIGSGKLTGLFTRR
jgi:Raf kinase inhibitor-like YbhB/YbcL family protein